MRPFADGPRRRRMIRGTIARIGELAMRYGHVSQLATLDCTSSRRSTVMCALLRATAVTTVYQRDSSSKRPRASVVSAARPPTRWSTTWRARRPGLRARGRRLRRPWTPRPPREQGLTCQQADACWRRQATIERSELDNGSSHIRLGRLGHPHRHPWFREPARRRTLWVISSNEAHPSIRLRSNLVGNPHARKRGSSDTVLALAIAAYSWGCACGRSSGSSSG